MNKQKSLSPALALFDHVWRHGRHNSHREKSASMQVALRLAIESGMEWAIGDCARVEEHWRPEYWMGVEGWEPSYSRACAGPHGPNPSAIKAIEAHLGRKPFLVLRGANGANGANGATRIRLCVGAKFDWHDDIETRIPRVVVTSFSTRKIKDRSGKEVEIPCVVACSYTYTEREDGCRDKKVDRVFRITHDDIAAYHKAIRDHARTEAAAREAKARERPLDAVGAEA